jgi:hypothetical protein
MSEKESLKEPLPEKSKLLEKWNFYLLKKYPPELIKESKFREGETPQEFYERLLEIYPKEEQKAYISALMTLAKPAAYGIHALIGLCSGEKLDTKILKIYPPDLNRDILGKMLPPEKMVTHPLKIDYEMANEIIRTCNLTASLIDKFGNQKVKEAREIILDIILRKNKFNKTNPPLILKIAGFLIGRETIEENVKKIIEEEINSHSLGILTEATSEILKKIAKETAEGIKPIHFLFEMTKSTLYLDDMNIYPEVGKEMILAYNEGVTTPKYPLKEKLQDMQENPEYLSLLVEVAHKRYIF